METKTENVKKASSNMITQYVYRGKGQNRRRVGLMIAQKLTNKDGVEVVCFGWSLCSRHDRFNACVALEIALTRAERNMEKTCVVFYDGVNFLPDRQEKTEYYAIPSSFCYSKHYDDFVERATRYFKDAVFAPYVKAEPERFF